MLEAEWRFTGKIATSKIRFRERIRREGYSGSRGGEDMKEMQVMWGSSELCFGSQYDHAGHGQWVWAQQNWTHCVGERSCSAQVCSPFWWRSQEQKGWTAPKLIRPHPMGSWVDAQVSDPCSQPLLHPHRCEGLTPMHTSGCFLSFCLLKCRITLRF